MSRDIVNPIIEGENNSEYLIGAARALHQTAMKPQHSHKQMNCRFSLAFSGVWLHE